MLLFMKKDRKTREVEWAETPSLLIDDSIWWGCFLLLTIQTPDASEMNPAIVTTYGCAFHDDVYGTMMDVFDAEWGKGRRWFYERIQGGGSLEVDPQHKTIRLFSDSLNYGRYDQKLGCQIVERWVRDHPAYQEFKVQMK